MELLIPEYYNRFSCIAAACPDSCCKEWAVDVDAESARMYRALPGALGDRLRQVLTDNEDGDTVMEIENDLTAAEKAIRAAKEESDQLERKAALLARQITELTARKRQLSQLQAAVSSSKQALQDAVSTLYAIRPEE